MLQLIFEITCLVYSSILNLLIFMVKREPLWAYVGSSRESTQKPNKEINCHKGKVLIGVERLKDKTEYQILRVPELLLKRSRLEPSSGNLSSNSTSSYSSRTATSIENRSCENEVGKHHIDLETSNTAVLISNQKIDDNSFNTKRAKLQTNIANIKMTLSSREGPSLKQHKNLHYTSFKTCSSTTKCKRLPPSPLRVYALTIKPQACQDPIIHSIDSTATTSDEKRKLPKKKLKVKGYEAKPNQSPLDRHGHCARCFKA
ncbi:hypothetical protein OnM2_031061 [Erysiphe neolycopersici]|uniref:Uncharacterized protein n=1 Tax=Erysiphe neolycopersici TaxID=212602 RepID=A0A420HZ33_9PEZI|nr:hypothetical protein OnM2_031061 [Erysiphe neolycopersici]